jgi:FkbM family methyltransferase
MVQMAMETYEPAKLAMIRRHLRPGMTFIDAGANRGYFTLLAARLVRNTGRVISIEPAPENYKYLSRSIELNGYAHVRALPIALSDQDGSASLQILGRSTEHTLAPLKPQYKDLPKVTVQTQTLDSVVAEQNLKRVDMVKIDVQEFELQVLRGAVQTLRTNPQLVMFLDLPKRVEMRRAIAEFLAPYGYTYFPDCNESGQTREIPPVGSEVAAIRL